MDNTTFDTYFKKSGLASQRRYPNEQAIQFLAAHYFSLPRPKRKRMKVLELGCGSGANLWMIAKEGFDAYGIDLSRTGLGLCRAMLKSYGVTAHLTLGNMRALPYKNNEFDAIVDVFAVEHTTLAGHREVFAEAYRALKSGGRFFSWHLGSKSISFTKGGGNKLDRYTVDNTTNTDVPYANDGISCYISAKVARSMLEKAGFTNISVERFTRTYKNMSQEIEYFALSAKKP